MASTEDPVPTEHVDFVIIGAGIAGINCAYRVQSQQPNSKYVVLEGRESIGGTWSLFKYPGIRSDSDLFTYGFEWNPWPYDHPIAEGGLIMDYLEDTVTRFHIREQIRFRHRVVAADWASREGRWTLAVEHEGRAKRYAARFMVLGTGYYDYERPLPAEIPGLDSFRGRVIHPQFWPADYDHGGQRLAIIGSGATAVSILPAAAKRAAMVTMIQRSPGYIINVPNQGREPFALRRWLPTWLVRRLERLFHMYYLRLLLYVCRRFPDAAREMIRKENVAQLPDRIRQDPHFKPRYKPWDQRMCFIPDNDFFAALRGGRADVVTGRIRQVTADGVEMEDGQKVEADAVVTATGIRMHFGGGVAVRVDGEEVKWAGRRAWNGSMIEGVPNMFFMVGYVDGAWTMGSDASALILQRLARHMDRHGIRAAAPRLRPDEEGQRNQDYWQLSSTYSLEGRPRLPVYGSEGPWRPKTNPPRDYWHALMGNITAGLHFS